MIDEQMKAPLPPPPARRARRGTRASQGGAPSQTEPSRPQESGASFEAKSQDQNREVNPSASRSTEPEESGEQGLAQEGPQPTEPQKESSSPEQESAEQESPSQGQPQGQVAESMDRHESPSEKPDSHEDQSRAQEQENASEGQPMSDATREIPEASAVDHAPSSEQATGGDQDSSDRATEQATAPSEKSELPKEAITDDVHGDKPDSVHEIPTQDERATEDPDVKGRELDSGDAQEPSKSGEGDASIATPPQSQDEASGEGDKGVESSPDDAGQSTDISAGNDHQQSLDTQERPNSPETSAASDVHVTDKPINEEEAGESRSQPTTEEQTISDSPAEHEAPKDSESDELYHGVVKGGAAEEYVKMAEAESGQEPQLGGDTSSMPEQNSSSGNGQSREMQDEDSSPGIEEPMSAQLDRESPEHTSQAQDGERPSSVSEPTDSAEHKVRSPVESEHESSQSQNRDIGNLDSDKSHDKPTVNPDQQVQSSSEQPELGQSQDSGISHLGDSKHEGPSSFSQDSPDVDSSNSEKLAEPELVEHSQNESASTEPASQSMNLDLTQNPESEENKASTDKASVSEKDASGAQSAEDQQEPHGHQQRDLPLESEHGTRELSGNDAVSGIESDSTGQQGPSSSDPSAPETSSRDAQIDKEIRENQESGSSGRHEEVVESHDAPQNSLHDSASGDKETPQLSSQDTLNIVDPSTTDTLPHESASEQETGDKRSDSGYETGMANSRNLEESTTTLHDDQSEHQLQPVPETEQPLASAPSESEQEKPREPRPEQILEGSGKGVSPPRPGGDHQGSDDPPVEETFDLSGSEPIPGTMTHGKDETEDHQENELAGGDVSSQDASHHQPDDNVAVGATAGDSQQSEDVDEARKNQNLEDSLPHESSQEANRDHTQPDTQSMAHDADKTIPADSRNQVVEEQLQPEDSHSVTECLSHGPSAEMESSPRPSTAVDPQHQGLTSNDGLAEQSHTADDVKNTNGRGMDEQHQDTSGKDDGAGISASQEQISEPAHISESPTAHDFGADRFGSWSSQAFSGPADNSEFSFKKRADSVQVGRSHGPADRGADLPSISTDGPNEDADEGLFAVPPTPRHEVDQDKPSQLQSEGESKPSSRASSRNGSTGAETLSPKAAEGLQGSHREESDREVPHEASATKEDVHHEIPSSLNDEQQARPDDVFETSESAEKTAGPEVGSEQPSSYGDLDRGLPQEPSGTGTESLPHETSAGDDEEHRDQKHNVDSPVSAQEQPVEDERHLDEFPRPESPSLDQYTSDMPNKTDVDEDHKREAQAESGNQSRDTSGEHNAEVHEPEMEHDSKHEGSSSNDLRSQTLESSGAGDQREGHQDDSSRQEMNTQTSSQFEQQSSESDKRSLDENDQVHHSGVSESQPLEDQHSRSLSPEGEETSNGQDNNKQVADLPQPDQGGVQHTESGPDSEVDQLGQGHADTAHVTHQPPSQYLGAQQVNYDGEGYGVTPSSEYSNDPLADPAPQEKTEMHPADGSIDTRQPETHTYDLADSARSTPNDEPLDSGSETFETPLESAEFQKSYQDSRSVSSGHFTQALDRLPDESAHTVQGTDDLFDDTDDAEDQDDYGEAVVYQPSNEATESSPGPERTVYSTRGDENNTALGGHRSSLSLGSTGHRSQGSISSMRDTTPVRTTFGSYIGGPSIVRADWAAEHEEELRPSSRNPTPQLGPSTTHDTPEISPFALRNTPMPSSRGSDQRGLSSSMWNPERPQTPPSATAHSNNPFATPQRQSEPELDPSLFVPRDVTHGRQDSIPASLHSQTTLDSSWSSPVHSSLPIDRHEPVIRDSWPAPAPGYQQYLSGWSSRPRGDTTSTAAEYDPFKPDNGGAPGGHHSAKPSSSYNPFLQRGRAESSVSATPSNPSVSNSPSRGSALFAKMRNIFENQGSNAANDAPASPGRTRPVSGVFHPAGSAPRKSQDSLRGQRDDERGGFLNEADHEIDERSAFLRSDGQPSGHMAYNDEH